MKALPGNRLRVWKINPPVFQTRRVDGFDLLPAEFARDDHAADLGGAGADLKQLGVAPELLDRVFQAVAVPAVDLHAVAGHLGG